MGVHIGKERGEPGCSLLHDCLYLIISLLCFIVLDSWYYIYVYHALMGREKSRKTIHVIYVCIFNSCNMYNVVVMFSGKHGIQKRGIAQFDVRESRQIQSFVLSSCNLFILTFFPSVSNVPKETCGHYCNIYMTASRWNTYHIHT